MESCIVHIVKGKSEVGRKNENTHLAALHCLFLLLLVLLLLNIIFSLIF